MNTAPQEATASISRVSSVDPRAVVLERRTWKTMRDGSGHLLGIEPEKSTWHGLLHRDPHGTTVIPLIGCPSCGGVLAIPHTGKGAAVLRALLNLPVPAAHSIDSFGKVSPDVQCRHVRGDHACGFHRRVYLDRWNKTKPLYAIAYIDLSKKGREEILIAYSHAVDAREARLHLGKGNFDIVGVGPAIGFHVDERTGKVSVE